MKKDEVIDKIKKNLQYPELTLKLFRDLKANKRRNVPDEFIEDAQKKLDKAKKLLKEI